MLHYAMDEILPPDGWLREEKQLVLLLHNPLENRVHSLPCVPSTSGVRHHIASSSNIEAKYGGIIEIEELRQLITRMLKRTNTTLLSAVLQKCG